MRLLLTIILSLSLYGCSTVKTEQTKLYDIYNKLSHEVKDGTILSNRNRYFTDEYLKEVNPSDQNSILLLNLSNYIDQEVSHYQEFYNHRGCFSINGVDEKEEPVSLHVEYKQENGMWLVNYTFLHFLESRNSYTKEALCPRDAEKVILDKMYYE